MKSDVCGRPLFTNLVTFYYLGRCNLSYGIYCLNVQQGTHLLQSLESSFSLSPPFCYCTALSFTCLRDILVYKLIRLHVRSNMTLRESCGDEVWPSYGLETASMWRRKTKRRLFCAFKAQCVVVIQTDSRKDRTASSNFQWWVTWCL